MTNPEASSEPDEAEASDPFDMDVEQNDPDEPGYLFGTAMGR